MILQKKVERAMALVKERRAQRDAGNPETLDDTTLEKGDRFAMILSAMMVFLPVALVVLLVLVLVAGLLFWR